LLHQLATDLVCLQRAVMTPSKGRWDLLVTVLALAVLVIWDASGLDLPAARLFGSVQGFSLRDSWWTATLLHEGGRAAAWLTMLCLALSMWCTPNQGQPSRAERGVWLVVMLLCIVAVPAIKHFSSTSCPWDLAEFGGVATYVSHWRLGVADGGPGGCFPSGHAVAAFGFFGMYFLWRAHSALRARAWLVSVLVIGLVFGLAQMARGAHYPSHTLWSAWLCWTLYVVVSRLPWLQIFRFDPSAAGRQK
jgi:membrane-associated PAP2 superfamily phosphatase